MSVLKDKDFNNISNFITSYLVRNICTTEELYNEYIQFTFGISKDELMALVGATIVAYKDDPIALNVSGDKDYLIQKYVEFAHNKNLHLYDLEVEILKDNEVKPSAIAIQRKYAIGFARATKIFDLKSSLY